MTNTLTLLGDSIFDNGAYVEPGQSDVTAHLKRKLVNLDWNLDMRAIDGAVVEHVAYQLKLKSIRQPGMIVLSVGGNDALGHMDLIEPGGSDQSVVDILKAFHEIRENFRKEYSELLDLIMEQNLPLVVCTIFNPKFPEPEIQQLSETGLSFFNDVITEEALKRYLPIIDLRKVCSSLEAFANPIEPSEIGGDLITNEILLFLPIEGTKFPSKSQIEYWSKAFAKVGEELGDEEIIEAGERLAKTALSTKK